MVYGDHSLGPRKSTYFKLLGIPYSIISASPDSILGALFLELANLHIIFFLL